MDEPKDHDSVSDCAVTVTTLISTTTTTVATTTAIESVIEEERPGSVSGKPVEGGDGACEEEDVMVEVLGSEVFVDGVTRGGGDVGGEEVGGSGQERGNAGNGDGGETRGDVGDEKVVGKVVEGGAGRELDAEGRVVDDEKVLETVVEGGSERGLSGEGGGVEAMELSAGGNGVPEGSVSCDAEVRGDQIEDGDRQSVSENMLTGDGDKDVDARQNVESVEGEGGGKNHEVVVEDPSVDSESRSKEPVISAQGDEQSGRGEDTEFLDGGVTMGAEAVNEHGGNEGSSCTDRAVCSRTEFSSLRTEGEECVKEQMQASTAQVQVKDNGSQDETRKEEVKVVDTVTSNIPETELSNTQTQDIAEVKGDNAENINALHTESGSLAGKASDDILCHSVDDNQQFDVMAVKVDGDIVNQNSGYQADTVAALDKVVVNEGPGTLALGTGTELAATVIDKGIVSEEPKDSAGGMESGNDSKLRVCSVKKVLESDGEVQCCGVEEKGVASEIDPNMKTESFTHSELRPSDESFFSCIEEAGKTNMDVDLEVKDRVAKSEILDCVKAEKSNDHDGSSQPVTKNHVIGNPLVATGVDDSSGVADKMKDFEGNSMEIDDAKGSPDHFQNQKVPDKMKLDDVENNGNLHPQLECAVEETAVVGLELDAADTNLEEQGNDRVNHQDLMSDGGMISENKDTETVPYTNTERQATEGDDNPRSVEGVPSALSLDSTKEVNVLSSMIPDLDVCPRQDKIEVSEGRSSHEQPYSESLDNCADQGLECERDSSLGKCLNENANYGAAQVDSNVEDMQETQEQAASTSFMETEISGVSIMGGADTVSKQDEDEEYGGRGAEGQSPSPDESLVTRVDPGLDSEPDTSLGERLVKSLNHDEEFEGHDAQAQLPLPDESLFISVEQGLEYEPDTSQGECLDKSATDDVHDGSNMEEVQEMQEKTADMEQVESPEEQEVDEEPHSESAKSRSNARRGFARPGSFVKDHQVVYQLPTEKDGDLSVFDLVWGKVKSHPWWPGQIFHPSDSSEKAMKYYRKDCYLVAYFGDRSFAWNDASVLKPFRKHFSQEEKQSNSEAFQNALSCTLAEVSRRVELGLACSCISEAAYDKIRYQVVENAGIREESQKREGVDRCTGPGTLQPDKLIEYVKALALAPTSRADRLDLAVAKAQLLAFNRLKGCDALADFQYFEALTEYDADSSVPGEFADSVNGADGKTRSKGPHRRKHNLRDIVYQRRKEKSLTELMGEYYLDGEFDSHEEDDVMLNSPTSGSKRKASDDFTAQPSTKTISLAKVSQTAASPNPQQSFKVGECIRRVASQLTGSPSILKDVGDGNNSKHLGDDVNDVIDTPDDSLSERTVIPQKQSSPEEMLLQLHLSARDPMKGYSFFTEITSFFSEFRNVAVSVQRQRMRKGSGRKKKPSVPAGGAPGTFEFDERNDSYWTDMVVQNSSEPKPSKRGRKRKDEQLGSANAEKPLPSNPRKYSRKQYFHGNHEPAADTPSADEKKKMDQLPTELMLNFSDAGSIPSEVNLNKMFRRFGPLKESETEVDAASSRAKVVFKKRSDAEVAYSSAAMFSIFGSTLVNYQLNYTPSISFESSPHALTDTGEAAT